MVKWDFYLLLYVASCLKVFIKTFFERGLVFDKKKKAQTTEDMSFQ